MGSGNKNFTRYVSSPIYYVNLKLLNMLKSECSVIFTVHLVLGVVHPLLATGMLLLTMYDVNSQNRLIDCYH